MELDISENVQKEAINNCLLCTKLFYLPISMQTS